MVRDNRVKEKLFDTQTLSAANPGLTVHMSKDGVNGEILEVKHNFDQNGSLSITISGTGEEIWRRNASSGAAWQTSRPRVFSESTTGSIANAEYIAFVTREPLILNSGSLVSGTVPLQVLVRYR